MKRAKKVKSPFSCAISASSRANFSIRFVTVIGPPIALRLPGSSPRRHPAGLGLTLAKKFVEMHGGRIWGESGIGQGSNLTFAVPGEHRSRAPHPPAGAR